MKPFLLLACLVSALFLSGCADQSLISDEEYRDMKKPAPFSPDPTVNLPGRNSSTGSRY